MTARRKKRSTPRPRCSFCGRDVSEVRWLVSDADANAFICDVCILLAVHALADKLASKQ